jgi:hypothetical protein
MWSPKVRSPWFAIVLVAAAGPLDRLRAEDLEGSLTLSGNVVLVRVFGEKSQAVAANIPLRLRDAGKKMIAAGRTDALGAWSFPLEQGGKYEVEVLCGPADDDSLVMPFSWKGPLPSDAPAIVLTLPCCRTASAAAPPPASPDEFPIETAAFGIGCLGAAGTLLFLRRLGTPA